jgi:hypothetical protein
MYISLTIEILVTKFMTKIDEVDKRKLNIKKADELILTFYHKMVPFLHCIASYEYY